MMLFLGAGASKPFGIKTMEEMGEEFENRADEILRGDKRVPCPLYIIKNLKNEMKLSPKKGDTRKY